MEKVVEPNKTHFYEKGLRQISLDIMHLLRQHPFETPRSVHRASGVILIVINVVVNFLIYLRCLEINDDVSLLSGVLMSFTVYAQITFKVLPFIYYRTLVQRMLTEQDTLFWTPDSEIAFSIERIFKYGYVVMRIFKYGAMCSGLLNMAKPLIVHELITEMYLPKIKYNFAIVTVIQWIVIFFIISMMVAINGIFLSMALGCIVQFKILAYRMGKAIEEVDYEELKRCVKHHVFIIRYMDDFQRLFALSLLGEYLTTLMSSCMGIYVFIDTNTVFGEKVASIVMVMVIILQFAFFCFPANEISTVIEDMSTTIYLSNWQKCNLPMQKSLLLLLIRTQRMYTMRAGGMLMINRITFINVYKTAFSFLTVLQEMKNN